MEQQLQRIVRVARMYYEEEKTQQDIANELQISRPLVSGLLARARALDIVRIEIKDPFLEDAHLLSRLRDKFGIQGGIIVPHINDPDLAESVFLTRAVSLLCDLISGCGHIGVGWGIMIDRIVECIPEGVMPLPEAVFSPMVGSLNSSGSGFHTNELVRRFADRFSAQSLFLNAPPFPALEHERELYMNTLDYKAIAAEYEKMDVAIFSVAAFPTVPDMASAYRLPNAAVRKTVVGEMMSYYFQSSGEFVIGAADYAMRIPLSDLKNASKRLAIIPGNVGCMAAEGILKSGAATHIVMDEELADLVLG